MACRRRSCNNLPLRLVQNIGQANRPNLNEQPSMQSGQGRCRGGIKLARNPKHDILFEPISFGPKTMRNRFLAVSSLHRLWVGAAGNTGLFPWHEGRRRLGGRLH